MLCLCGCLSVIALCLGFGDVSFRSSVMEGEKPILRMGPSTDETVGQQATNTVIKEPAWVTQLRTNLKQAVREEGFEDAKPELQHMIEEADTQINGEKYDSVPAEGFLYKNPMRGRPPKRYVPQWERELIAYIRQLMKTHGKDTSLDPYVDPLVREIQRKHNVKIHNIDGQIIVRYDSLNNNGQPPSGMLQRQSSNPASITGYET